MSQHQFADVASGRCYAIQGLIESGISEIKTKKSFKGSGNLIHPQKETFENSSIPNEHISNSNQLDSEILKLVSECVLYGHIHQLCIYKK